MYNIAVSQPIPLAKVLELAQDNDKKTNGYRHIEFQMEEKNTHPRSLEDDKHFVFFRDLIEPLYKALEQQNVKAMYEVLGTTRQPIQTKRQKKQWKELTNALQVAREGTIYDVLQVASDSRLIPISPDILKCMEEYDSADEIAYAETTLKQF